MKKQSLRTQLLWSHLALVGLMALVMLMAVINFFRLGRSVDRILKDNQASVMAAQRMKEALERQDSAASFFLAGQQQKARQQYEENWPRFQEAHAFAASNITEVGEREVSDDIGRRFTTYRNAVEKLLYANPPLPTQESRRYYFSTLEPAFVALKGQAQAVLDLNQRAIERADERAKKEAERASWLSIAMTIGSLGLAVIFAHHVINAALTPLLALAQGAEEVGAGHLNRRIELHRSDEIGVLAQSFNQMAEKLREARRIEQQRLHRAQKMSDAALESLYDPVLVTDATGAIVQLNRAAEGLFGPGQEAAGLPVTQVVGVPRIAEAIERAVRQERVSAEEGEEAFVPLQMGETQRVYRLRATPMRDDDGTLLGAALVLEDITHLRELDHLKSEFISVASHELRTPVTSLMLSAQLLQEGAAGPLTAEQQEIVSAQREDLQRLEKLMRDLLDLTRLEAGVTPPRFEVVAPGELVEAAHDSVSAQAAAEGVHLETEMEEGLPKLRADRAQITRVLINLLNNAVRHTPEGGTVKIAARRDSDNVLFRVSDTGEGIPCNYLPRIFERFVQVPGATRGGAGLGLSIAQGIVQAHGGQTTVESEPGKGTTFEFPLPVAGDNVQGSKG